MTQSGIHCYIAIMATRWGPTAPEIGKRLRRYRLERGLTLEEAARDIINFCNLSVIESGRQKDLRYSTILGMAKRLRVHVRELLRPSRRG